MFEFLRQQCYTGCQIESSSFAVRKLITLLLLLLLQKKGERNFYLYIFSKTGTIVISSRFCVTERFHDRVGSCYAKGEECKQLL